MLCQLVLDPQYLCDEYAAQVLGHGYVRLLQQELGFRPSLPSETKMFNVEKFTPLFLAPSFLY